MCEIPELPKFSKFPKVPKFPRFPNPDITRQIIAVAAAVKQTQEIVKLERFRTWRAKMRGSVSSCFCRLRGPAGLVAHMVYLGEENASECLSQALQVFKRFWNTVWQRQLPDLEQQTRGCLGRLAVGLRSRTLSS